MLKYRPVLVASINAGSQLYGMAHEGSDVDKIEVYLPHMVDALLQGKFMDLIIGKRRWGDPKALLSKIQEERETAGGSVPALLHAGKEDTRTFSVIDIVSRAVSGHAYAIETLYAPPEDFIEGDHDLWLKIINSVKKEEVINKDAILSTLNYYIGCRERVCSYVTTDNGDITGIKIKKDSWEELKIVSPKMIQNLSHSYRQMAMLYAIHLYGTMNYKTGALKDRTQIAYNFKRNPTDDNLETLLKDAARLEWTLKDDIRRGKFKRYGYAAKLGIVEQVIQHIY